MPIMDTDIPADENFYDVMKALDAELHVLRSTARRLADVGLDRPADAIGLAEDRIASIAGWLHNNHVTALNQRVREAEQASANVLTAVYAGLELGGRSK